MIRSGTAASTYDVDQFTLQERPHLSGHHLRALVIFSQFIGHSGIRVCADKERSLCRKFLDQREHPVSSERAVQSDGEHSERSNRREKGIHCLTGKNPPGHIRYRCRNQHRHRPAGIPEGKP